MLMNKIVTVFAAALTVANWSMAQESYRNPSPFPAMPNGITSFGAAVQGDHLYVIGGALGGQNGRSTASVNPQFIRLNLNQADSQWEQLTPHRPSQSVALVAHGDYIYRVAGLSFANGPNDDTIYESTDLFSRYNPKDNSWTDLPNLPGGRSSLDAAVLGDKIYVVGGWNLSGPDTNDAHWYDNALSFDLSDENATWTEIAKPPFETVRALSVAAHQGKIYAFGGMNKESSMQTTVTIYDPQTDSWSSGPDLVNEGDLTGFATSSFATGGHLYYSGGAGLVYRLSDDGSAWEPADRLMFPRMFHRMVPASDHQLLAVAGIAGRQYLTNVEIIDLRPEEQLKPKTLNWSIDFGGKAKQSQALLTDGTSLYVMGGNHSHSPHDFSQEAFSDEAFRFDVSNRTFEKLPNLPRPLQSGAARLTGASFQQQIDLFGGLSHDGTEMSSIDSVYRYDVRRKTWAEESLSMPSSRAMFDVAELDGAVWMFGGSESNTNNAGLSKEIWHWFAEMDDEVSVIPELELPTPRRSFGQALVDDKLYLIGGLGEGTAIADTVSVFDFNTRTWSTAPSPNQSRVFPSVALAAGKIYLSGGFAGGGEHFEPANSVEIFDPETQQWSYLLEEAPFASGDMVAFQNRLLFFEIDEEKEGVANFVILDPNPSNLEATSEPAIQVATSDNLDMLKQLNRMDKNLDGHLASNEVSGRWQALVARADANNDGVADRPELINFVTAQLATEDAPPPRRRRGRRGPQVNGPEGVPAPPGRGRRRGPPPNRN